jgi:parvulin-like peptidyl-prolyl isomerase
VEIKYSNGTIIPEDIVKFLALTGQAEAILKDVIKFREAKKKAAELGLKIQDEKLQEFADNFRKIYGLITAEDTYSFLNRKGLTEDDFEQFCETSLLVMSLKDNLSDETRIEEYFLNNRSDFDRSRISMIIVKDEGLANEIVMQVSEEGEDFHMLARKHSIDMVTKYAGGYVGAINRRMLDQGTAAKVFNASPGDLLGPFRQEGFFQLILVEDIKKAELDNVVVEMIKERILEEWFSYIMLGGVEISL